jgi:hypothetical protein
LTTKFTVAPPLPETVLADVAWARTVHSPAVASCPWGVETDVPVVVSVTAPEPVHVLPFGETVTATVVL